MDGLPGAISTWLCFHAGGSTRAAILKLVGVAQELVTEALVLEMAVEPDRPRPALFERACAPNQPPTRLRKLQKTLKI